MLKCLRKIVFKRNNYNRLDLDHYNIVFLTLQFPLSSMLLISSSSLSMNATPWPGAPQLKRLQREKHNLVWSIYLPIMTHSPTSLSLHLVCQRQSNISILLILCDFTLTTVFLCWKINKIAPPKSFLTCWYIEVFQTFRQRQDITKHALALMHRCSSSKIKMGEKLSKKQD